jgi:AraC-like DNA-binding protein
MSIESFLSDWTSMPSRSTLLNNYPVMNSRDPDLVRDRLFSVYGVNKFEYRVDEQEFLVRANHLQMSGIGLSYCDYGSDVSIGFDEGTFVRQIFNISGWGHFTSGRQSADIAPRSCTPVLRSNTPLKLDFRPGYRQLVLRVETAALRYHLGTLLGQEIGALVFDERTEDRPAMDALRRKVFDFAADFNARGANFSDLAAAEVERMVIMKFLMCHRHNYTHLLLREPLPVARTAVKKVEEFIEANWDRPMDVRAMSIIANVSARSLFRQFKKDRGYSPADFAKQIRLDRAREMLEQGNERASVTQIALRCGFQNPGHFARDFRLAFGELPSQTLRRSLPPSRPSRRG